MKALLKTALLGAGLLALAATSGQAAGVGACLITKTDTNPFFVKMKEGAPPRPPNSALTSRPMPARTTATMKARWPPLKPASPMAPRAS